MKKLLNQLKSDLENEFKDNFTGLVLFGSYAKNNQNKDSDLDVLITFKKLPKTRLERIELIENVLNSVENVYNIPINPIIKEEKELKINFLMADIEDYAKILIDKNHFIKKLFKQIKNKIEKGYIKKIMSGDDYRIKIENA